LVIEVGALELMARELGRVGGDMRLLGHWVDHAVKVCGLVSVTSRLVLQGNLRRSFRENCLVFLQKFYNSVETIEFRKEIREVS
jgi:hypothetical protein